MGYKHPLFCGPFCGNTGNGRTRRMGLFVQARPKHGNGMAQRARMRTKVEALFEMDAQWDGAFVSVPLQRCRTKSKPGRLVAFCSPRPRRQSVGQAMGILGLGHIEQDSNTGTLLEVSVTAPARRDSCTPGTLTWPAITIVLNSTTR
jgi:hypothetical protein